MLHPKVGKTGISEVTKQQVCGMMCSSPIHSHDTESSWIYLGESSNWLGYQTLTLSVGVQITFPLPVSPSADTET